MQPYTGQTFEIPTGLDADTHVGSMFTSAELVALREELAEREAEPHDLDAAIASAANHGPLVGITPEVAHAQRLGQRELDRRKRRRKAARDARRRSR